MLSSALLVDILLLALGSVTPAAATPATSQSTHHRRQDTEWQKYVRAPASATVLPATVLSNYTQGNVTNPNGLLTAGGDTTVLTRPVPASGAQDVVPQIVIDFGQNTVGYLSINFAGSSSDATGLAGIRLAFSESIEYGYLTNVSDFTRSQNGDTITPGSDQIAVQSQAYTWTAANGCENGTQVCADGLHGFRYLRIYLDALASDSPYTSAYGQVSIDSISLNYTGFLGTPDTFTGWFDSSDDDLNQWFYDAVYTTDMGTTILENDSIDPRNSNSSGMLNRLVLLDGAKRDRLPYSGDLAVSARTSYLTRNKPEAARNVLSDLADHQRADGWIPPASINDYQLELLDYPLWWVANSYDLLVYTGNTSYFDTYYQTIVNALDNFYPSVTDNTTQLITKGVGISTDYGDYAFLGRTGAITYFNALYVLALNNAASIATLLGGHDDDATRWTTRAQTVASAINSNLFDSAAGAYFDGTCGSSPCQTHAQDGNSLSIVSGVADSDKTQSALSYMATHMNQSYGNAFYDNDVVGTGYSQKVYAFISYFELEARFLAGSPDTALEEIRRLYGWMASHDPGVTAWEGIGTDGLPYEQGFTSMAHGWSTGIVPVLMNYVLGVMPTGTGFNTWAIKPLPGDVQWAQGQVPTPNGEISVSWNNTGSFSLSVSTPSGGSGTVSVPVASNTTSVFVDSQQVWPASQPNSYNPQYANGYVELQAQGGDHTITVGSSS